MNKKIIKAIFAPFRDDSWKNKLFILTLFSIPNLLVFTVKDIVYLVIFVFLMFPICCISIGYCIQFAHNEINKISPSLPCWNIKVIINYLQYGFYSFSLLLIYAVPFIIIGLIFSYYKTELMMFLFHLGGHIGVTLGILALKIFYILFFSIIYIFALGLYCNSLKLKSAFSINKIFNLIPKAKYELCVTILLILFMNFGANLMCLNFITTLIYIFLIPIQSLVIMNLIAQTYNKTKF